MPDAPISIAHAVDNHRPKEHAVDLGPDQRLGADKTLDLGENGSSALSLPHARFRVVIHLVDQVRESLDVVSSEIGLKWGTESSLSVLASCHCLQYFKCPSSEWATKQTHNK